MRASSTLVPGVFHGADIEPGTFHQACPHELLQADSQSHGESEPLDSRSASSNPTLTPASPINDPTASSKGYDSPLDGNPHDGLVG